MKDFGKERKAIFQRIKWPVINHYQKYLNSLTKFPNIPFNKKASNYGNLKYFASVPSRNKFFKRFE